MPTTRFYGLNGGKRQRYNKWIWADPSNERAAELLPPEFDDYSKFDPPACTKPAIEQDEYAFIFWNMQRYHDRDYGE